MQRLHREVLPALMRGDDANYAELRCVEPATVGNRRASSAVMDVMQDSGMNLSSLDNFQPTHAREVARHFRKRSKDWDDATKEEILDWVDRCENEGWTVQQLRDRLDRANRDDVAEAVSHGAVVDLNELVAAGTKFGAIYADPPWAYDNKATRSAILYDAEILRQVRRLTTAVSLTPPTPQVGHKALQRHWTHVQVSGRPWGAHFCENAGGGLQEPLKSGTAFAPFLKVSAQIRSVATKPCPEESSSLIPEA